MFDLSYFIVADTNSEEKYWPSLKSNVFFGKCNFAFNLKICILALFKALNRTLDTEI